MTVLLLLITISTYLSQVNECGPFHLPTDIRDGVKIIELDSGTYIIGVASVANSSNQNTKSRISVVRARRNVNDYINGTTITSETILETGEVVRNDTVEFYESFHERIIEQGSGFVEGMQVACTWVSSDGKSFYTAIYRILK